MAANNANNNSAAAGGGGAGFTPRGGNKVPGAATNFQTTSNRHPRQIMQELQRALTLNRVVYKQVSYCYWGDKLTCYNGGRVICICKN